MNKNSNAYIIIYATVMVVIVALVLAYASMSLKARQTANVENEMKGAILMSIGEGMEADKAENKTEYINEQYDKYIVDGFAVNTNGDIVEGVDAFTILSNLKAEYDKPEADRNLPIFVGKDDAGNVRYILPLRGKGLWGPIWGYLAMEGDWQTIYGVVLDHQSETPGLGAEIATPLFQNQFKGKSIFRDGNLVGIFVLKGVGSSAGNNHAVDAISGGTITSRGVESMLKGNLEGYSKYIDRQVDAINAATAQELIDDEAAVEADDEVEGDVELESTEAEVNNDLKVEGNE